MKKLLKQITILCLAFCCLAVFVACGSPGDEFAGEYEFCDYEFMRISDTNTGQIAVVGLDDPKLQEAINDSKTMVGIKVKLTAKEVLFCDTDLRFDVESYQFFKPNKDSPQYEDNTGLYKITTNNEKLIIDIRAFKSSGIDNNIIIRVTNFVIGSDGEEYRCFISFRFLDVRRPSKDIS